MPKTPTVKKIHAVESTFTSMAIQPISPAEPVKTDPTPSASKHGKTLKFHEILLANNMSDQLNSISENPSFTEGDSLVNEKNANVKGKEIIIGGEDDETKGSSKEKTLKELGQRVYSKVFIK